MVVSEAAIVMCCCCVSNCLVLALDEDEVLEAWSMIGDLLLWM